MAKRQPANLPNYPRDEVKEFGERVASAITDARIRKSMHGLGGCKEYKPEDFEPDIIPYIDAYLKGDLDSVAIIYAAMRTKELEIEGEKSYPSPKG